MSNLAFETHKIIHKLEQAGVEHAQAEAITEVLAEIYTEKLVTKEYLDQRLRELEYKLTIKMGTMFVVAVGVLLTAIKYIH